MMQGLILKVRSSLYNANLRRAILVLGVLVVAALVGGAPNDFGGG